MATKPVSVRFSAEGGDKVVAAAKDIGDAGDRHLGRVAAASRPASRGLKLLDGAAKEARQGIEGLAGETGRLGAMLGRGGPVGLAIAAAGAAMAGLARAGANAAREVAGIGDAADRLQVDVALFEQLSAALTLQGQSADGLESSLRTLQQRLGEAAEGSQGARDEFARLGVTLGADLQTQIAQLADGLKAIEDPARRVAVANRLLGETGGALLSVLGDGADGFARLGDEAERLGLIYGADLIAESQRVTAELDAQDRIISTRLNVALAPFAALWLDVKAALAELLIPLGQVLTGFRELIGLADEGRAAARGRLNEQIADLENQLAERERQGGLLGSSLGGAAREAERARSADLRRRLADARAELMMLEDPAPSTAATTPTVIPPAGGGARSVDTEARDEERRRREAERDFQQGQRMLQREAEKSQRAMQDLGGTMGDFFDSLVSGQDPLRATLGLLGRLAEQVLTGSGALGGAANDLFNVDAGGLLGRIFTGAATQGPPMQAAFGGDFRVSGGGGHDSRQMRLAVTPSETVSVRRRNEPDRIDAAQRALRLSQGSGRGRPGFQLSRADFAAQLRGALA